MINAKTTNYTNNKTIVPNRIYRHLKSFDILSHKLQKLECDIYFLKTCAKENIIPNFIKHGLKSFKHLNILNYQRELLQKEIKLKLQLIQKFKTRKYLHVIKFLNTRNTRYTKFIKNLNSN